MLTIINYPILNYPLSKNDKKYQINNDIFSKFDFFDPQTSKGGLKTQYL